MNHRNTDKESMNARAYSRSLPVVNCEGTAQGHSQGLVLFISSSLRLHQVYTRSSYYCVIHLEDASIENGFFGVYSILGKYSIKMNSSRNEVRSSFQCLDIIYDDMLKDSSFSMGVK